MPSLDQYFYGISVEMSSHDQSHNVEGRLQKQIKLTAIEELELNRVSIEWTEGKAY